MTGLSRSSFRNVWILLTLAMLGGSFFVFQTTQGYKDDIQRKNASLRSLKSELDNAARRAEALKELDGLTINEKTATRLDILRHLGLEQSGYKFDVNGRQVMNIGNAVLYQRMVRLVADLPYAQAMALVDQLHETRKIVINQVELRRSTSPGDKVNITIEGKIYGLEKNDAI
ncbi:MAG: hypothetical protein H6922_05670 [Pseudomonadaceae bacterium]|nr:hypothetical protein [Pseudomonadaceae bacterium]